MTYPIKKILILLTSSLFLSNIGLIGCTHRMAYGGCAYRLKSGECTQQAIPDADIMATTYAAADNLIRNALPLLDSETLLLVTSIADLDNLEDSTSLGRLIGEQLSARFAQQGYTVIETKLNSGLRLIPRTGEFVLSREMREMGQTYLADMVVSGTYALAQDTIYITLKMFDFKYSRVIASYAYTLPMGPNTSVLSEKSFWWW